MKYLRYFENNSTDKYIMDIEDILSELSDNGFNIDVKPLGGMITGCINIIITRNEITSANFRLTFTYDDLISEVMNRLFDYCKMNNLETEMYQFRIVDTNPLLSGISNARKTKFIMYQEAEDHIERIHIQVKEKQVPFWQSENN